jgi:lipopolysaccharide export system protein LptA
VRFTIERLRTLVLVAGVVLLVSLAAFLARGRLRNPFNAKELPQKLGLNIVADASGFTLDHAYGGHSRYRIHASKAVQYKDNHAILKDVQIELYSPDGSRVDRINGAEFEYDQQNATAVARGPVEITLTRPAAGTAQGPGTGPAPTPAHSKATGTASTKALSSAIAANTAAERGEIHVKTSGLTFDTRSGIAKTAEHVDFSMAQGDGSSMGASYDSQGLLVLEKAVVLNTRRGKDAVSIRAAHAEFERDSQLCKMHEAAADFRGATATAGDATVLFRDDGTAARLDVVHGFNLKTANGGEVTAPTGSMEFDEHNQPRLGHLEGGVQMESLEEAKRGIGQRQMHGSAPTAELAFNEQGELRHVHFDHGVEMRSESVSSSPEGPLRMSRTWKSPVADLDFRNNGKSRIEPASIHGVQGVVVTGERQVGMSSGQPSRLSADELTGDFDPNSALRDLHGSGHTSFEETNAAGARQTSTGDRLEVQLAPGGQNGGKNKKPAAQQSSEQIESGLLEGNVTMTQLPAPRPNAPSGAEAPSPLRAWAGRAVYDGAGEWLHLTMNPRVEDGGLELTSDKIDVSHQSGDAFAHGNVKATWLGSKDTGKQANAASAKSKGGVALGGHGPAHVIAEEAQLSHAPNGGDSDATFRGHARLWQAANSVAAPLIVLDRDKQTLVAHSTDSAEPVRAVLLSAGGLKTGAAGGEAGKIQGRPQGDASGPDAAKDSTARGHSPSLIRVSGGDLKYSEAERKAVMRGGALGEVMAETGAASSKSSEVELVLLPPGNHAGPDGGSAQVDRMTARGHVVVSSNGRRGTGEQLVYTSDDGRYVLTGTAAAPPRMTDPARGNVTGEALIFSSRDDSVTIEGGGGKTTTETTTPR